MRPLPQELVEAIRRARYLEELSADGGANDQRQRARQALNAILLAAVQAGWQKVELAPLLGVARQTVTNRVAEARERYGDASPALVVEAPPAAPADRPKVADELARPVSEREWLTTVEAAALVGRHPATVRNWYRAGLLPHTRVVHSSLHLLLRADVLRVAGGEQYRNHGVDWTRARAAVREERMHDRLRR